MSNNQSSRSKPTLPSFQSLLRGLDELGPLEDSSSPVPGRGASPVYPGPLRTEDAHHPYNTQWHSSPMQEAFASTRPPSHPASWAGSSRDPSFVEGNQNQPEWSTSLPHHLSQSESSPRHGYSMRAHTLPQPFIQRPHSIPPSSSPRLNHIGPMGNPAIPRPPSANSYRFPAYSTKDERSRYPSLTHYTQPYGEEIPSLPRTVQRSAHGEESFALRASMHGRSSSESDNSYRAVIAVAGPSEDASPSSPSSTQDGKVARYPCSYCGKRFNRPSSLKIHVNIHTGDRRMCFLIPLVCVCPLSS
ncbi:hypothetical protein DL93DRAFT_772452 [Clavulina sp. PMI_390]|nr:hypothetical protein DL93DRAFT_772452 [Clavulina sp. PMI_390]